MGENTTGERWIHAMGNTPRIERKSHGEHGEKRWKPIVLFLSTAARMQINPY